MRMTNFSEEFKQPTQDTNGHRSWNQELFKVNVGCHKQRDVVFYGFG